MSPDLVQRTDAQPEELPDADTDGPSELRRRFEHAVHGLEKPSSLSPRQELRGITSDQRRRRMQLVADCVRLGFSAEQMANFLATWGLKLSRSTVYDYLSTMRLPRWYRRAEGEQSHHDYYTLRFFLRIAEDAHAAGYTTRRLMKGRLAWEGMRFRPDFKFEILHYLFFMEVQLSDLTETRWSVKFRNYLRLKERTGQRFRALFVIDQKGDLSYARRFARELLEQEGSGNVFLFISLDDLKGSSNVATDPVWLTPWGERESLLQWLGSPGQKPAAQC